MRTSKSERALFIVIASAMTPSVGDALNLYFIKEKSAGGLAFDIQLMSLLSIVSSTTIVLTAHFTKNLIQKVSAKNFL